MAWGKYLSPRKFVDAGESDVEAFLQHLADQGKAGWQIEQAEAALKLLHQSRYPAPWSADWKVRQPLAAATASPERRPPLRLLPPRSQSNARTHRRAHRLQNRARDHSGYPGTQTRVPLLRRPHDRANAAARVLEHRTRTARRTTSGRMIRSSTRLTSTFSVIPDTAALPSCAHHAKTRQPPHRTPSHTTKLAAITSQGTTRDHTTATKSTSSAHRTVASDLHYQT